MKFTILTQYYEPEIGAPQRRLSSLAKSFVLAGHEVTVLTAMPNYPKGKIYPGYGGWFHRETVNAVDIVRTFIHPSQSLGIAPRLANYFSFVCSSSICGMFALNSPDYLLVESPPLFLGIAALWLSWMKRAKLIFNVSDLWPESALRLGIVQPGTLSYRLAQRLEAVCYQNAWLVTGQSKSILKDIQNRFPSVPALLLSNGVDTTTFHPEKWTAEARGLLSPNGEFVIVYAGLHGLAQGLSQVLEAAQALRTNEGYRFVFIGDGPEKKTLIDRTQKDRLSNVKFIDSVPGNEMPPLLAAADLVIVPLATNIPGAVPSKLYEAMASGRPTILIAEGEAADIVRVSDCGLVVSPRDIETLVHAIKHIRTNPTTGIRMGANGRQAALGYFDRAAISRQFVQYLESNCGRETPAARRESHSIA